MSLPGIKFPKIGSRRRSRFEAASRAPFRSHADSVCRRGSRGGPRSPSRPPFREGVKRQNPPNRARWQGVHPPANAGHLLHMGKTRIEWLVFAMINRKIVLDQESFKALASDTRIEI